MEVQSMSQASKRFEGSVGGGVAKGKVCYKWRTGNCNRYPCPFLHEELVGNGKGFGFFKKHKETLCRYWLKGSCNYGEQCKFLHSWYKGNSFSLLAQLEGHENIVTGIALPSGSDKLHTGSKDGILRIWDCNSGQSTGVFELGGEIGCVVSKGPWIFVGLTNLVRAWNTQTNDDFSLQGPIGQVYAIIVVNNMLFVGAQDGSILVWKFDVSSNSFQRPASLEGHSRGVVTLTFGGNRLYSGSVDGTIRVWNLENLQCIQTLTDHTDVVMSLICYDQFLLSCSLDRTVKVWASNESGDLEVTYTHNEKVGLIKLHGTHDAEKKSVLLCSCIDDSICIYDLPSFAEKGKIFSKMPVRAIQDCLGGIFFTDDGTGTLRVWKWEG